MPPDEPPLPDQSPLPRDQPPRRGYATRAARLTAHWLLHEQHASMVELCIDAGNTASQRVAAAAGFTPAGTIQSHVPATGQTYDDLRFVLCRH